MLCIILVVVYEIVFKFGNVVFSFFSVDLLLPFLLFSCILSVLGLVSSFYAYPGVLVGTNH